MVIGPRQEIPMIYSDIAIKVENLSKCYHIYDKPRDWLLQMAVPKLHRLTAPLKRLFPCFVCPPRTYYKEFWSLRDVSFQVNKGETVGIIGRNGSGKSTLLQMICGTLNPTSGNIETLGRMSALLELGSGFNPEFTGRENVYLRASVLGLHHEEINSRFADIAAFADIDDFIERPVKTYSSGMVLRLAFAVQAMTDPDILIVDEALAVGDEKFQRKCFAHLEKLKNKGTSILFVSHSASQVIELCDRAMLLDRGRNLMISTPEKTVRIYQRLIYAPANEQQLIIQQAMTSVSGDEGGVDGVAHTADQSKGRSKNSGLNESPDFFDPNLIPQTTTVYAEQGARIAKFTLVDDHGREVNVLTPGKRYWIEVTGQFFNAIKNVHFGFHVKNTSGVEISGQRYPGMGKDLPEVVEGKAFKIKYGIQMQLLPGVYFVGGGIWKDGGSFCAHRVLDAMMFRVKDGPGRSAFGYCDLASGSPELEIYN